MRSKFAVAVFAALSSLAVTLAPTAAAWGEYAVTTPGAYILSTAVDQNGNPKFCTAGFVVRTPDGGAAHPHGRALPTGPEQLRCAAAHSARGHLRRGVRPLGG